MKEGLQRHQEHYIPIPRVVKSRFQQIFIPLHFHLQSIISYGFESKG
jgi:hypothetical protein